MSSFTVKIDEKKNTLTITADLINPPTLSTSRKSLVIATSHGNHRVDATVNGKPVTVGFSAYIANANK